MKYKIEKIFFTICLSFLLILAGCSSIFSPPKTHQEVLPSEFGKTFQPEELKADIDFLFSTLESIHPNLYAYTPKDIIDKGKEKIFNEINKPINRIDFFTKIAPLVAKLNDGHTNVYSPYEEYYDYVQKGGLLFPFNLSYKEDKAFIFRYYSSDSSFVRGTEIISINKIPSNKIKDSIIQYKAGERYLFKLRLAQNSLQSMLWYVYKFTGPFEIEYILPSIKTIERKTIVGVTNDTIQKIIKKESKNIVNYYYKYYSIPEEKIGIIDFRAFADYDQFIIFLSKTFTKIKEENIKDLIIDIRNNGGGNSSLGDALLDYITDKPFSQFSKMEIKISPELKKYYKSYIPWYIRWLPLQYFSSFGRKVWGTTEGGIAEFPIDKETNKENTLRYHGNIYLLTGSGTFSSAVALSTAIKDYKIGTIIGEETGGLATSYGDIFPFDLPNTYIQVGVSHKRFVRPNGEDDKRGVLPDYEVTQTKEDTDKNLDTVMEFTKNLIRKSRKENK
jgi:hypothetical protein